MRDPSAVEANLVALLRELSRRAGRPASEAEARAALAPLSADEAAGLRAYAQEEPPARPLGAMAWADLARGTPPQTAAARELTGYYEMQAERDALAQMLRAREGGRAPGSSRRANQGARGEEREQASRTASAPREAPALANHVQDRQEISEPAPAEVKLEHRKLERKPIPRRAPSPGKAAREASATNDEQAARLLTLFAYHRDTPLVARALACSLAELEAEIDRLGLRRKTGKLLRGLDTELPAATARKSAKSAPVRRRSLKEKAEEQAREERERALAAIAAAKEATEEQQRADTQPTRSKRIPGKAGASPVHAGRLLLAARTPAQGEEAPAAVERAATAKRERLPVKPSAEQAAELRALLREIGPRRAALAARLGAAGKPLSPAALLARFRAAGLEREFGQRERDLIRALLSRHRSALGPAAAELGVHRHELEQLIRERGLAREVEEQREQKRTQARASRWPKARLALYLERREWLADLGLLDELEDDLRARVALIWRELPEGPSRLEALAGALGIAAEQAQLVASQLAL